jgi:hypothetical protein
MKGGVQGMLMWSYKGASQVRRVATAKMERESSFTNLFRKTIHLSNATVHFVSSILNTYFVAEFTPSFRFESPFSTPLSPPGTTS